MDEQILSYSGVQICTPALEDKRAELSKMPYPCPMTQQFHFLVQTLGNTHVCAQGVCMTIQHPKGLEIV